MTADFAHPEYLVETAWLAEHLDDPDLRILEVTAYLTSSLVNRAEEECYLRTHIPGSVFFDSAAGKGVLSDPEAELPWMWPTVAQFEATMGRFGIGNDTRVVLVARTPRVGIDEGTMWCTRAWWTMHHMGVDCAVLRGGIEKWEEEGRPMVIDVPAGRPAEFRATPGWEAARATREDVLAVVTNGGACLIDALPETSFDGTDPGYGPRSGHITGASNLPFRDLISGPTARFHDAEELQRRVADRVDVGGRRVVTYCGGAIAATTVAFVLELLGHDQVAVYDGSLMEWSADPALPMD